MVSGLALSAAGVFGDLEGTTSVTGIAGAICCISAIAALAKQETARAGNAIGIAGVGLGVASTVGDMTLAGANLAAFEQTALFAAGGATIGGTLGESQRGAKRRAGWECDDYGRNSAVLLTPVSNTDSAFTAALF